MPCVARCWRAGASESLVATPRRRPRARRPASSGRRGTASDIGADPAVSLIRSVRSARLMSSRWGASAPAMSAAVAAITGLSAAKVRRAASKPMACPRRAAWSGSRASAARNPAAQPPQLVRKSKSVPSLSKRSPSIIGCLFPCGVGVFERANLGDVGDQVQCQASPPGRAARAVWGAV